MKRKLFALLMAVLMLNSLAVTASAATASEKQTADALHSLGLFLGTGDNADGTPNYALDGNLTRSQAVVLLVRMLGKEDAAAKGSYAHPFKDTAGWYDKYVGYAYANKLTNGTGADTYSGEVQTTAQMFATFCLRALGYDDMGDKPDFSWDKASEKAKELGVGVDLSGSFTRGDAVETFWDALNTKMKGSSKTLAEKLEADGMFTKAAFDSAAKIEQGKAQSSTSGSSSGSSGGSSSSGGGSTGSGGSKPAETTQPTNPSNSGSQSAGEKPDPSSVPIEGTDSTPSDGETPLDVIQS